MGPGRPARPALPELIRKAVIVTVVLACLAAVLTVLTPGTAAATPGADRETSPVHARLGNRAVKAPRQTGFLTGPKSRARVSTSSERS